MKVWRESPLSQVDADIEERSVLMYLSAGYVADSYAIWHVCS